MKVRRATAEDIPVIVQLASQLGAAIDTAQMPVRLQRILEHSNHAVFVAERDIPSDDPDRLATEPCGFAAAEHRLLLPFEEWIELTSLVVDEASRRQGFGSQLVAAVEAWAARRGVPRVLVRSSVTRVEAHDFYPRLRFARTKTQHVYVHDMAAPQGAGDDARDVTSPGSGGA